MKHRKIAKFPFLRRPLRLILSALLMALLTTAALLFAWQYRIDGLALEYSIDTYAYVGTVTAPGGLLAPIPEEVTAALGASELVLRTESRQTQAALLGEAQRQHLGDTSVTIVPDKLMEAGQLNRHYFLQGTVLSAFTGSGEGLCVDSYCIGVEQMWGYDAWYWEEMDVTVYRDSAEPAFSAGQRVFLVGDYTVDYTGLVKLSMMTVYTAGGLRHWGGEDTAPTLLNTHAITAIPAEADPETFINEYMARTGMAALYDRYAQVSAAATVRRVGDMMAIPAFAGNTCFLYEGRALTPEDAGKKVCVIEQGLSNRNRIFPGDTIQLSLADGCYTTVDGWESGNPTADDAMLEYGAYETYEVVGVFTQRGWSAYDPECYSRAEIFLPADADAQAAVARGYTYSFRVAGPDHEAFLAWAEPMIAAHGCKLSEVDSGWDEVEENFYAMQTRRTLMLWAAIAAFAAAVVLFAALIYSQCRYELGLRRLMGATRAEAMGICVSAFCFAGVPAGAAAIAAAWSGSRSWMREAMETLLEFPMPTDAQCAGAMAVWTLAALAVSLALTLLLCLRSDRRSLLKLLRR